MTEKEKVKAYDEAIERVKKSYGNGITEGIFPELKESDDEKMRNFIINELACLRATNEKDSDRYEELTNAIAWLEKQRDKDKLIQELGEYKVKYTQEVLEKYVNNMSNKDDERLRKTTIAFLKDFAEQGYENAVECIDWLENQGKEEYGGLKSFKDEDVRKFMQYIEKQAKAYEFNLPNRSYDIYAFAKDLLVWLERQGKNSTDKDKLRFNVGDWVIYVKSKSIYQVEKKENYEYTLRYILGGSLCLPFSNEELIREWTIQDAKDGDVLVNGSNIFIFHFINNRRLMGYCHVNMDDGNFYNDIGKNECFCTIDAPVTPATKEQRDALIKAMNDAGYEWDTEKKELIKEEET